MSHNPSILSNAVWDALSDVERAALLLLAADVEDRKKTWPGDDQIDPRKIAVLYDGLPLQSLLWDTESHPDPRLEKPTHAALVAIDRAARALLDRFELRDRVSRVGRADVEGLIERGRRQLVRKDEHRSADGERAYRNAPVEPTGFNLLPEQEDCDWLAFAPATISPGEIRRVLAQPCDPFVARRLAVTVPQDVARSLRLWASCRDGLIVDGVSAETFVVRLPNDPREPIERGARIQTTRMWPSIPMVLTVENRSIAPVEFTAVLRGRSLA